MGKRAIPVAGHAVYLTRLWIGFFPSVASLLATLLPRSRRLKTVSSASWDMRMTTDAEYPMQRNGFLPMSLDKKLRMGDSGLFAVAVLG